jgi:hypothetical protein
MPLRANPEALAGKKWPTGLPDIAYSIGLNKFQKCRGQKTKNFIETVSSSVKCQLESYKEFLDFKYILETKAKCLV